MQQIKKDINKLYSIEEYSKLMGVTRQTVYNWIADSTRKIKVVNISGRKFIEL